MPPDDPFAPENQGQNTGQNFDYLREAFDLNTSQFAQDKLASVRLPTETRGTKELAPILAARANAPARANPYDLGLGNQARDGYLAALDQLHNGTSVVGGQANQAMGQLGQQVGNATANTSSGLAQMMATRAGAQGAGDVADQSGNARLNEFMNQQKQYGNGMSALRGQDLQQSEEFQNSGLKQRGQDDALHNFYTDQGVRLDQNNRDVALNKHKLQRRLEIDKGAKNQKTAGDVAQVVGSIIKMIAGGG